MTALPIAAIVAAFVAVFMLGGFVGFAFDAVMTDPSHATWGPTQ